MKTLLTILMLAAMLVSCGTEEKKAGTTDDAELTVQTTQPQVEVMYFHGKQRCMTCKAIEKVASETVAGNYAPQIADGKIRFTVIDIDSQEGEAIADKYRIARSSLLVVKRKSDGSESVENMTDKAFANARNNPDAFITMLCEVINRQLN
ncbi:nitrophenyl compound nitroreductase subunit ArsF family protein [Bacteroides sp. AN502(2024)]|uniref:nitrophenyl compound nitroreductase subunit ArsF family protein n=1 Tax=Bacteroides sp. AN502(2024) TaxID=3160599 RepID=UPI003511506C